MKKLLVALSILPLFIGCKKIEKKQQETQVAEVETPKKEVPCLVQ